MSAAAPISIVAYGVGNIASVANMLRHVGADVALASTPDEVRAARKLVLPGVGAFDYGMERLARAGLREPLDEAVLERRTPVLGICLGMQLMCRSSEEGRARGLGWVEADVHRFDVADDATLKVPHMGWNVVQVRREDGLLAAAEEGQRFYFVHSYHVQCDEAGDVVATARHGQTFVAAFRRSNIHGVQFHPEKSHRYGMSVLRRYAALPC